MANPAQTNINLSRYFFATQEAGEQTLNTETQAAGNLTDFYVSISGPQGNAVQINQMPDIIGTVSAGGEEMLYSGTASTYKTLSSLTANPIGTSISIDRFPGSGTTCIEAYVSNGAPSKAYEFLIRTVTGALVSTTNTAFNNYISSSFGQPGATAILGNDGLTAPAYSGAVYNSIDAPTGGGGRGVFVISDLSGTNGAQPKERWAIGTSAPPTGGDIGSDFTIYSYADSGAFKDAPFKIRRLDSATAVTNISSMFTTVSTGVSAAVFPTNKTNAEFGAEGQNEIIAGSTSNQALYGSTWAPLFSTIISGANPNGQTFLSINWANALSTGSNHVNYKVGFSTATAYTNVVTTSYVPGGQFTGSDLPSANTPIGHTLVTCCLDSDGVNPDGTATLYVQGQISDPAAAADQIFIAKGQTSEPTRNSLVWHAM